MKRQVRKQKGFSPIIAIIAVGVVVVIIALFLSTQKGNLPTPERAGTQKTTQGVPAIQNTNGLNAAASALDNTDLNQLDKELNQLDSDASTF